MEIIAYFVICFIGGIGVSRQSGIIVGFCIASAWILGRANG